MANVSSVSEFGNQLVVNFDDGTRKLAVPTGRGIWLVAGAGGGTDPSTSDLYNPFGTDLSVGGDWQSHLDRTDGLRGGNDWPFAVGTPLPAPGAGILQSNNTGGLGDLDTGDVGAAGLRSILWLDTPAPRKQPKGNAEADGPMEGIVFQHQSSMGTHDQHYAKEEILGYSGDTGNAVAHLHIHGITRAGERVDYLKFF